MRAAFGLLAIVVLLGQVAPAHGSVSTRRRPVTARLLAHVPASCGLCEERERNRIAGPRLVPPILVAADGEEPGTPLQIVRRANPPQLFHPRRLPPRSRGSDADAAH